jgi:hypothetical protein
MEGVIRYRVSLIMNNSVVSYFAGGSTCSEFSLMAGDAAQLSLLLGLSDAGYT